MSRPQTEFRDLAAAGIIVLLALLISMNLIAIIVRQRFSSRTRW
jgi:phosphate transport system permease protein